MILVVTANSNTCRIYHYNKKPSEITLIREILHPENRLKNGELTADRPGHYNKGESSRGAYSPPMEAKEIKIDNFSREIAKQLSDERHKNGYEKFILIAPPHVSGLINQHIDKLVKDRIAHHILKDVLHLSDQDLLEYIKVHTKYEN